MKQSEVYGYFSPVLEQIKNDFERRITSYTAEEYEKTGIKIYEHLIARVKSEESMEEKCRRKGLEPCPHTAMKVLKDSIGIRIVCSFIDDIYTNIARLRELPDCRIAAEKDYIKHAKPNGYRSYHTIIICLLFFSTDLDSKFSFSGVVKANILYYQQVCAYFYRSALDINMSLCYNVL